MRHVIVRHDPGVFYAWPANCGLWSWGPEIAVGFTKGRYREQTKNHSVDNEAVQVCVIARSMDAGESWQLEEPGNFPEGPAFGEKQPDDPAVPLNRPIDFTHTDLAIRCRRGQILVSMDRCRSWAGPYKLTGVDPGGVLTSRTDYHVLGQYEALFFVSYRPESMASTILPDQAFVIRTADGGMNFEPLSVMLPEADDTRSVMPSTVMLPSGKLVSALRRRSDEGSQQCWIDTVESEDDGASWRYLSRVAATQEPQLSRNGNPPGTALLGDGRLVVVYGYRAQARSGIRARVSADEGQTWGDEIILRDDARTWDIGYPRSAVRADGKIVSTYYFTTDARREQHIAATIWDPDDDA